MYCGYPGFRNRPLGEMKINLGVCPDYGSSMATEASRHRTLIVRPSVATIGAIKGKKVSDSSRQICTDWYWPL